MTTLSDDTLRKILVQIQQTAVRSQRELNISRQQMAAKERERRILQLTIAEITSLQRDVNLYKGVGKMFMMVPRPTMEKELKAEEKDLTDDINNLNKKVQNIKRNKSTMPKVNFVISSNRSNDTTSLCILPPSYCRCCINRSFFHSLDARVSLCALPDAIDYLCFQLLFGRASKSSEFDHEYYSVSDSLWMVVVETEQMILAPVYKYQKWDSICNTSAHFGWKSVCCGRWACQGMQQPAARERPHADNT